MYILEVFWNAVIRKIRLNINGQEDVADMRRVGGGGELGRHTGKVALYRDETRFDKYLRVVGDECTYLPTIRI